MYISTSRFIKLQTKFNLESNLNYHVVVNKMASNGSSSMDHLQEALESFIEKLRVIGVIAGDYQLENAAIFKDKM